MNDDLPSEPMKYAINPIPLVICLSLALWGAIETVVMMAVRIW